MLVLAALLVALALVPLIGGRLGRLAGLRLVSHWLVACAVALQLLANATAWDPPDAAVLGLHVSSYVVAGAFVWRNRHISGLPLLAAGAGLNAVVLALNAGRMPATAAAAQGRPHLPVDDARLGWLGDLVVAPAWLPPDAWSAGDLLVALGAGWLVLGTCRPRRSPVVVPGQRDAPAEDGARRAVDAAG